MLPEVLHYMEEPRECEFYPGCNYKIIFQYEDNAEEVQQDVIIPSWYNGILICLFVLIYFFFQTVSIIFAAVITSTSFQTFRPY